MFQRKRLSDYLELVRIFGLRTSLDALVFDRTLKRMDARFQEQTGAPGPVLGLGAMASYEQDANGITVHTGTGSLRVDVMAEDCLRIRVAPGGDFSEYFSYAVTRLDWPAVDFDVKETADAVQVVCGDTLCNIGREHCQLTLATRSGRVIVEDAEGPAWQGMSRRLSLRLAPHESGHGLGERAFGLNLRGRSYQLWNADPAGYNRGDDPINMSIPLYVGLRDQHAYGVFWDNSSRGEAQVGVPDAEDELIFSAESGDLCYYLFAGPTALQVMERYTELTGRLALPPLWMLGYHQCRWSYMSSDEVRRIAAEFRRRQIPCDALYLDIDYMDGFRCFTWDSQRFGDLPQLVRDIREQGFRTVSMIDPGIKADHNYAVCASGLEEDVFVKYPDGKRFVAPVWPGNCYFPDFTSPRVREWWGEWYAGLLEAGIDGFWNDMGEPAVFSASQSVSRVPDYLQHDMEGHGASHLEAHNVYGMQMGRATREGLESLQPDRRHVVIVRAGYAGVQRYATSWTADNISTWDHLRLSVSMCLNLGLSGLSFTGPDIGGFGGNADGELFVRWVQLAVLLPFFRGHSAKGTRRHEPWAFGEVPEQIARKYIELRYRLLPYIYSVVAECADRGWPIVRLLALADASFADCDDQYLLGDKLLAAPVAEQGAVSRTVRLPEGVWYDYWTGNRLAGDASYEVDAPLDALPLYVRAGSVLPHWPVMQHTGEVPIRQLELRVYPGSGESVLYEDRGEGKAYEHGEQRWSTFACSDAAEGLLVLQWQRKGVYDPGYSSVLICVTGLVTPPDEVVVDGVVTRDWRVVEGVLELTVALFEELVIR